MLTQVDVVPSSVITSLALTLKLPAPLMIAEVDGRGIICASVVALVTKGVQRVFGVCCVNAQAQKQGLAALLGSCTFPKLRVIPQATSERPSEFCGRRAAAGPTP